MIVTIPYTDGEYPGCATSTKLIVEQLKKSWKRLPEIKECSIDNIEDASIYIGGDHTITYYTVKQFVKNNPNTGFVVFDAHADVFQAFDKPSHQDYLKFLIEENILDPNNVVVIGLRAAHPKEIMYFKEKGIQYYPCYNIMDSESICDGIMEYLRKCPTIYLSIDIDVLNPSEAPGVSYTEPSGLTLRELLYFIQRLKKLNKIKTMDIVEVNADNDVHNLTVKTAAKIIAEFL